MIQIQNIYKVPFFVHLGLSVTIRLALIFYGEYQDSVSEVQYTDVDYRVVTDGARHILNNQSPYSRHTYRYSPLLAYMLIPNILWNKSMGKVIFCIFDLIVGILIKMILSNEFFQTFQENSAAVLGRLGKSAKAKNIKLKYKTEKLLLPEMYKHKATLAALTWLYNPLTMVIATRGNGDSITCALVLFTLYLLLRPANSWWQYFVAGLVHGVSIHFRLYPIFFSLAYFFYSADNKNMLNIFMLPSCRQICLVIGTFIGFFGPTVYFYQIYGYQFLYETYIYHLVRKDTRHNFSLYFYMQYLNVSATHTPLIEKLLTILPQILILLVSTFLFSYSRKTLPFVIFIHTFTMVTFNSVVTSQYFLWFLSVMPLCLKNWSGRINAKTCVCYAIMWIGTQGNWLLSAYLLEFKGWNTFHMIWLNSLMFFGVNVFLLQSLISNFNVIADFRHIKEP